MSLLTDQSFLAMTVLALWGKSVVMSLAQVAIRVRTRRYSRPEDARMMGYETQTEDERIARLSSAWRNELEATPLFLMLAIVCVLLGSETFAFEAICVFFVAARYAHGWAQFTLRQPHRTIAYLVGLAASLAMAGLVLMHLLGGEG